MRQRNQANQASGTTEDSCFLAWAGAVSLSGVVRPARVSGTTYRFLICDGRAGRARRP